MNNQTTDYPIYCLVHSQNFRIYFTSFFFFTQLNFHSDKQSVAVTYFVSGLGFS